MGLHAVQTDTREDVWLAAGLHRQWRITSANLTYGEFDDLDEARAFLWLLVKGNPERLRARQ